MVLMSHQFRQSSAAAMVCQALKHGPIPPPQSENRDPADPTPGAPPIIYRRNTTAYIYKYAEMNRV